MVLVDPKTGELIEFNRIDIRNLPKGINQISIGIKNHKKKNTQFCYIDITLPTLLFGNNKNNINNMIDFLEVVHKVNSVMNSLNLFHFDFDLMTLEISSIEINKNILITEDFSKYKKAINLIFKALQPKLYKNNKNYGLEEMYSGSICSNNTTKISIYNKSKQLEEEKQMILDPNERIMRLEITKTQFHKRSKNTFNKLLRESSFNEVLESLFNKSLQKNLGNELEKILYNQSKDITEFLNNSNLKRKSYLNTIIQGNEVFDIIIPLYSIKGITDKRNYTRTARNLINSALKVSDTDVLFGNIEKLNFILESIGLNHVHIKLTNVIDNELKEIYNCKP